jgi:hypothetical protein
MENVAERCPYRKIGDRARFQDLACRIREKQGSDIEYKTIISEIPTLDLVHTHKQVCVFIPR